MKILYITTGMGGYPHHFLDLFISAAVINCKYQAQVFEAKGGNWPERLMATVNAYRPNYVFTIHGGHMPAYLIQRIKQTGAKIALWCVDDPYDIVQNRKRVQGYDFIFTNEKAAIGFYHRLGCSRVHYLPLGVQKEYYHPENVPAKYHSDICVVGSPFNHRVDVVQAVLRKYPHLRMTVIGPRWNLTGNVNVISRPLGPEEIRKYYNGALINLNIHRGHTEQFARNNLNPEGIPAHTPNNRTFDVAACNAFQLVDMRPGLGDFFNLDQDLVVYHNTMDLLKKISRYHGNEAERRRIAKNSYNQVLNHHRFEHRIEQMIKIVSGGQKVGSPPPQAKPHGLKNDERLVINEHGAVYLLRGGKRHLIADPETFKRCKYKWEDVVFMPDRDMNKIPRGNIIKS